MFTISWHKKNPSVGPTYHKGYVGIWPVFVIKFATVSDALLGDYILVDSLPGLSKHERCSTIDAAKQIAEERLKNWVDFAIDKK